MVKFTDKRAGSEARQREEAERMAALARDDAHGEKDAAIIREDGTARRLKKGARPMAEFFSEENTRRPVTRGELLGFFEFMAYVRKESRWHRAVYRWLFRKPGPEDMWAHMATAYYERTVVPMLANVARALEERKQAEAEVRRAELALVREEKEARGE